MKRRDFLKAAVFGIGAGLNLKLVSAQEIKKIHVKLSTFKFRPSVIKVNQGDFVQLVLEGVDITHGFYIDGYDIGMEVKHAEIKTLEFTADKAGAFRIRCNVPCGNLHPFMTGKLIVEPDYRLYAFSLASLALPAAALLYFYAKEKSVKEKTEEEAK